MNHIFYNFKYLATFYMLCYSDVIFQKPSVKTFFQVVSSIYSLLLSALS